MRLPSWQCAERPGRLLPPLQVQRLSGQQRRPGPAQAPHLQVLYGGGKGRERGVEEGGRGRGEGWGGKEGLGWLLGSHRTRGACCVWQQEGGRGFGGWPMMTMVHLRCRWPAQSAVSAAVSAAAPAAAAAAAARTAAAAPLGPRPSPRLRARSAPRARPSSSSSRQPSCCCSRRRCSSSTWRCSWRCTASCSGGLRGTQDWTATHLLSAARY
jgi:hypothetical protein